MERQQARLTDCPKFGYDKAGMQGRGFEPPNTLSDQALNLAPLTTWRPLRGIHFLNKGIINPTMAEISIATEAIKKGLGFSRKNFKGFFTDMFRVHLFAMALFAIVAAVALGIIAATVLASGGEALLQDQALLWQSAAASIAILIIAYFIMYLLVQAAESTANNLTDGWVSKKKAGILGNFRKNLWPVLGYILLLFAINVVFVWIPAIVLAALLLGGFMGEGYDFMAYLALNLGEGSIRAYTSVAGIVIGVLVQFALWELVIARRGVVRSFGESIEIVKKTLVPTIVFDIVAGIIGFVAAVVGIIAIVAAVIALAIALAPVAAMGTAAVAVAAVAGIAVVLVLLAGMSALVSTFTMPMQYMYWKKARAVK